MKNNTLVHLIIIVLLSVFFCSCEEKSASDNASNSSNQEVVDKTNINMDSTMHIPPIATLVLLSRFFI